MIDRIKFKSLNSQLDYPVCKKWIFDNKCISIVKSKSIKWKMSLHIRAAIFRAFDLCNARKSNIRGLFLPFPWSIQFFENDAQRSRWFSEITFESEHKSRYLRIDSGYVQFSNIAHYGFHRCDRHFTSSNFFPIRIRIFFKFLFFEEMEIFKTIQTINYLIF